MKKCHVIVFGCALATTLHAAVRTSTSYIALTETVAIAGGISTSASYSTIGSAGLISGVAEVGQPSVLAKSGYIGQLYEVTALQLGAAPTTVNEGGTRQLEASAALDDSTTLTGLAGALVWSVVSGPITSLSSIGLATAATVYQNTAATVRGGYSGQSTTLNLSVLDTIPDNFGNYAGDGLPDGWQVQHFGVGGTSGGPMLDPDFDGLQNRLEYALNLTPTEPSALPASLFNNGGVLEYTYTRSKAAVTDGTQFQVEWSETLGAASWSGSGVAEEILSDNGTVQEVKATFPAGSLGRRFARLRVW